MLEHFAKKDCKKQIKQSLELNKRIKQVTNFMLNEKVKLIHIIPGQIKNISLYKTSHLQNHTVTEKTK